MTRRFKLSSKKYKTKYIPPTKEEKEFDYNVCKKVFCNPNCDGFEFNGDKKQRRIFKKGIKNGFSKTYGSEREHMFKGKEHYLDVSIMRHTPNNLCRKL